MKHAFCVVAYGESPFLRACMESIVAQQGAHSTVVVTTSTPSGFIDGLAADFALPVVVNRERCGIGADWNFALGATDAELVTLAHQDDLYRPAYAAQMQAMYARHPQTLIAFSDFQEHTAHGPRPLNLNLRIKRYLTRRAFRGRDTITAARDKRRLLAWGNPVCCPSVVVNRSRLPDFGFTRSMASNLDWEAWSRLASREGAFAYVPHVLVSKMVHAHSETSAALARQERQNEDREMFERFWPRSIARGIAAVYRSSYLANRV